MNINLQQPYPLYCNSWKRISALTAILAVVVPIFMYFFQPFTIDVEEHRFSFVVVSLLNGLVVSLVFLAYTAALKILFPYGFRKQTWTLGKEIGFWTGLLLMVGFANFFRRELIYDNVHGLIFEYLVEEIFHAWLVGFIFVAIFTTLNYIHLLKSTTKESGTWDELIQNFGKTTFENPEITITSDSPRDTVSFRLADFMYAVVDGNYVEFYFMGADGNAQYFITRNTLSNVEAQTEIYPDILRVHRSYLVNVQKVVSVSGNTQGYKLALEEVPSLIPVSRSYIPAFEESMKG